MLREPTLEEIQYLVTLPFDDFLAFTGENSWQLSIYNRLRPDLLKPVYVTLISADDEQYRSAYLYDENMIVCDPFAVNNYSILEWIKNVTGK